MVTEALEPSFPVITVPIDKVGVIPSWPISPLSPLSPFAPSLPLILTVVGLVNPPLLVHDRLPSKSTDGVNVVPFYHFLLHHLYHLSIQLYAH